MKPYLKIRIFLTLNNSPFPTILMLIIKVILYKPIKKYYFDILMLSDQLLDQHEFILKSGEILL